MAKIGLAAELAKQAAKAARDEVQATEAPTRSPIAGGSWHLPTLTAGFRLDDALSAALGNAQTVLNRQLAPEGLVVSLQQGGGINPHGPENASVAIVQEIGKEKIIKNYNTLSLLQLYSAQRQSSGAVVDGQV